MRARSGTRTFSCVIFSIPSKPVFRYTKKQIGAAAHRQPRIRAVSNLSSARITRSPGPYRIQARADNESKMSSQHRLAGKFFLDGLIKLYRESGSSRKAGNFGWGRG